MATFSFVHGSWHGGWAWDLVRAELERHGHVVHAPDLPIEDLAATARDYAALVPAADVVVGHSNGGYTIGYVDARVHVYLCAIFPGVETEFVPGFGEGRRRDELGRSYYPDPAVAARELQYPPEHAHLARLLRRQSPVASDAPVPEGSVYVVCARDAVVAPDWQRRASASMRSVELDAGHSPMLSHPRELAELLLGVEL